MFAFLFCSHPLNPRIPDDEFMAEYNYVKSHGYQAFLFSYELLNEKSPHVLRKFDPAEEPVQLIYRGWMLKPDMYKRLYALLSEKNYKLINTPEQYAACHYLPNSLRYIKEFTPTTEYFPHNNIEEILAVLSSTFGNKPIIVKDFVKSCKHNWKDACFIKDASNIEEVVRVTNNFLDLQGHDLNVGLVYREYVDLKIMNNHSVSGMPLANEYRLFFYNHKLIYSTKYWSENDTSAVMFDKWVEVAKLIPSDFFTMDVAEKADGSWCIIELGDGQVSGLQSDDPSGFYEGLFKCI